MTGGHYGTESTGGNSTGTGSNSGSSGSSGSTADQSGGTGDNNGGSSIDSGSLPGTELGGSVLGSILDSIINPLAQMVNVISVTVPPVQQIIENVTQVVEAVYGGYNEELNEVNRNPDDKTRVWDIQSTEE